MKFDVKSQLFRYALGFMASLVLTLITYAAATERWIESAAGLVVLLLVLASAQIVVQAALFLHIFEKRTSSPNWRLYSLVFTAAMLVVIVVASLWIMRNLDYNMMNFTPAQKTQYMRENNDKGF